jgi:hypothetical protein
MLKDFPIIFILAVSILYIVYKDYDDEIHVEKKETKRQIKNMVLIYFITYMALMLVLVLQNTFNFKLFDGIAFSSKYINIARSKNYFLKENNGECNKNVLFTYWNLTHFFVYFFIGYYCPQMFRISLILGVLWEVYESLYYCHDIVDIICNSLGFITGFLVKNIK